MDKDTVEAAISALETSLRTIDTWVLVFAAAVAISLTVEVVFSVAHWIKERQLTPLRIQLAILNATELKDRDVKIADLNNETARLRAQNALTNNSLLANVQAGRANALAVESGRSVTEVLAVTQGLVKRETISEATKPVYIIEKVAPFAGKKFDVVVTSVAINLGAFAATLRVSLKKADWIEIERADPTAGVGILFMDRTDGLVLVTIDVDASKDPELLDAAKTLASALNAEGIAATVEPKAETDATNVNVIHIFVGPKP